MGIAFITKVIGGIICLVFVEVVHRRLVSFALPGIGDDGSDIEFICIPE
jgi:hypothetical protein